MSSNAFSDWNPKRGPAFLVEKKKPEPFPITKQEVFDRILELFDHETIALADLCYLSAGRISEVLDLKPQNLVTGTVRGVEFLSADLKTLKNKRRHRRQIPIANMNDKIEHDMACKVLKYIDGLDPAIPIFDGLSRNAAAMRFKKISITTEAYHNDDYIPEFTFHLFPHYFRHCRLTHVVVDYALGEDPFKLQLFAGWSTPREAMRYVLLSWKYLAKQMIKLDPIGEERLNSLKGGIPIE